MDSPRDWRGRSALLRDGALLWSPGGFERGEPAVNNSDANAHAAHRADSYRAANATPGDADTRAGSRQSYRANSKCSIRSEQNCQGHHHIEEG